MSRATSEKGSVGVTVGGTRGTGVQGHVVQVYRDTWDTWGWIRWIEQTLKPPF